LFQHLAVKLGLWCKLKRSGPSDIIEGKDCMTFLADRSAPYGKVFPAKTIT
jgi:hypothetical protein